MKQSVVNKIILTLPFVFLFHNISAMDKVLIKKETSTELFDKLPQELRKSVFGQLLPRDVNSLRKTCCTFSQFFSFINPSAQFLAYDNKNIHKKDLKGIFFAALYDEKFEIVNTLITLMFNNKINCKYRISGTPYVLYSNDILQACKSATMKSLLQSKGVDQKPVYYAMLQCCEINPLLIACVSRNNKRVKNILMRSEALLTESMVSQATHVAINNNDEQTISILLSNDTIRKYTENNGVNLILHAIARGNKKACESFIISTLCDMNQKTVIRPQLILRELPQGEEIDDLFGAIQMEQALTLLDVFYSNKKNYEKKFGKQYVIEIESMLIKSGARTTEELEFDDFVMV